MSFNKQHVGYGCGGRNRRSGESDHDLSGEFNLAPPQPTSSGYGDTLIASNPFDDTPEVSPIPRPRGSSFVQSDMVYRDDQNIIVNPRMPNHPPIYPCGTCFKEIRDDEKAIPCESGCKFWYHGVCTGLTKTAYQLLIQEVYAEWVCNKCLSKKTVPPIKYKA